MKRQFDRLTTCHSTSASTNERVDIAQEAIQGFQCLKPGRTEAAKASRNTEELIYIFLKFIYIVSLRKINSVVMQENGRTELDETFFFLTQSLKMVFSNILSSANTRINCMYKLNKNKENWSLPYSINSIRRRQIFVLRVTHNAKNVFISVNSTGNQAVMQYTYYKCKWSLQACAQYDLSGRRLRKCCNALINLGGCIFATLEIIHEQ